MDCIFCTIASGGIPAKVIKENEHGIGILDIHPRALGHTVVFPKLHAYALTDMNDGDTAGFFILVRDITSLLSNKLSPDGFTIGINHGESAGQEVGHIHVHIIPRWKNDGGSCIQSIVEQKEKKSLDEIHQQITS